MINVILSMFCTSLLVCGLKLKKLKVQVVLVHLYKHINE